MPVVVIDAGIKWWNGETDCISLCRNNIRYGWMLKENRGKCVKDGRESEILFQTIVHGTHFSHRLNRNAWLFTIYIFQGLPTRSVELPLEQTHARTHAQVYRHVHAHTCTVLHGDRHNQRQQLSTQSVQNVFCTGEL